MKTRIAEILDKAKSICCFFHKNPDGDAVGSALAVKNFYGDKVRVYSPTPVPEIYLFLPGASQIKVYKHFSEVEEAEVFLVLDCADLGRVPGFEKKCSVLINVDHHETNTHFGDFNLVDPTAASTCELVFELLKFSKKGNITKEVADCVYTGLYTDTGGFKFSNTNKKAFEVACELLDYGVNPAEIASAVYESYPFRRMKLLAKSLDTLELHLGGKVASMYVTLPMYKETGALPEDTEEFVDFTRAVKGVIVAVFLRELDSGGVKVSLRSKGNVNVAEVAKAFGGGGHFSAAGCEINSSVREALALILKKLAETI